MASAFRDDLNEDLKDPEFRAEFEAASALVAAIDLIDAFLADTRHQSLLDADKVRDFLLDLRSVVSP